MPQKKVFVSPGVYTSEKDLTFVKQSIGVTTLGLVGETTKGPAHEPIFIKNYDDFLKIFGGQVATKDGNGYVRYQLPYVARQYLKESNQLFVTRVLGYSGYDAGECTWAITLSGTTTGSTGTPATNNMVVALLRSRRPLDSGDCYTTGLTINMSGSYTGATTNPQSTFGLSAHTALGTVFYEVSLDSSSSNFITKVLGDTPQGKDTALWVEEIFDEMLDEYNDAGIVTGVKGVTQLTDLWNYEEQWLTPESPWVLSEIRGNRIERLFKFISISDGDSANRSIKISIENIDFDLKEFDIIIRDFNDTDRSPSVLEKFSRCTMNTSLANYVGKRVGTSDGEYTLRSSYVMLEINSDHPIDAFPAGFAGYSKRTYTGLVSPQIVYKTSIDTTTEKIKRTYFGVSDTIGIDPSFFDYKGLDSNSVNWTGVTEGFHMDSNADDSSVTVDSLNVSFQVGESPFTTTALAIGTDYEKKIARKFTLMVAGGFDGWDVYRTIRSNTDTFRLGQVGFINGGFAAAALPNVEDGGTSDYYAYLNAILTFQNPESVNINVFATPGINYVDHSALINEALDMIEDDRADSLYVIDPPDITGNNISDDADVEDAIDNLDSVDIDSNYATTFFPYIQVKDIENGVQIWMPATLEVVRSIARTDNIAYPWFAPVGYNRGVTNALKARIRLTQSHRDDLYKARMNPVATFSDIGVILFGQKTLQVNESALDRINVRRLLLQARKLISAVAVRLLFEPNDDTVREQFLDLVNPILENIRKERGLEDFRVVLSSDPEEIDRNEMRGKIFIKPTRALEFIEIEFNITPTGASFDDV